MKWIDAIGVAQGNAAKANGKAADGTAQLTRRDASGLILFGKEAHKLLEKATVRQPDAAHFRASTFDWYAWSLPVLGWFKRGDKFNLATKWETSPLDPTTATTLWAALVEQAHYLDDAGIPFKLVRDPRGSASTFKTLAMDSYRKMQQLDPKSADVAPHKRPGTPGAKPNRPISHDPDHPSQTVRPPTIVIQPPITVDHPDGGQVTVQPPPVVVPPSVPAPVPPPPPGAESAPSSPDAGPGPGGGGSDGPPSPAPPVITPPPIVVPPKVPGGTPLVVQPPPVVAHPINAPQTADPYDWYWRQHEGDPAHDPATWQAPPPGQTPFDQWDAARHGKKPKGDKNDKKSDGGGVAIMLLLLAMAMDS